MLKNRILVPAKLLVEISYVKDGMHIDVEKSTPIFVDEENNIALIGKDNVDISEDEYALAS